MNLIFFLNSILLGVGLSMDAFSISVANGLNENKMRPARMCIIATTYAFFQFLMPMVGWICVHTICGIFTKISIIIPFIALVLLAYIGIKMIIESAHSKENQNSDNKFLSLKVLLIQGIGTSIDALSVGFTISDYKLIAALICSIIIAIVTYIICYVGLIIGKKAGTKITGKADLLGGIILILIGLEIFIKGFWFK